MNSHLQELMRRHGLHQHIDADCQHRMEMLARLIVLDCCNILKDMQTQLPGYRFLQVPTDSQIYRLKRIYNLEDQ